MFFFLMGLYVRTMSPEAFTVLLILSILAMLFGGASFVLKLFAPRPFVSGPGLEYLSNKLQVAKRFMKDELRLGTGILASDPPSHEKQLLLIEQTSRELPSINKKLAARLSDTDWESVPFQQWMDRIAEILKSAMP